LLLNIIIFRHTLVYLDYKQVFVNIAHMINDLETIEERLKSVESNNVYDNGDDNDNNYIDDDNDNDFKKIMMITIMPMLKMMKINILIMIMIVKVDQFLYILKISSKFILAPYTYKYKYTIRSAANICQPTAG